MNNRIYFVFTLLAGLNFSTSGNSIKIKLHAQKDNVANDSFDSLEILFKRIRPKRYGIFI